MKKKIFSICLSVVVLVALIAVLVQGCGGDGNGDGADTYALTMAANPTACGTATDLTNASPYAANATVNIRAVAAACCQFVNWSAPDGTFDNATAAETTFTMPAQDVTVTANFEPILPLDHFKGYGAVGPPLEVSDVQLKDQFITINNATVGLPYLFCNPVVKEHDGVTPISDPNNHLTWYVISYEEEPQQWEVTVNNQFGPNQELTVAGPFWLAVPTEKEGHEMPECLEHFLVYQVINYIGEYPGVPVLLSDQFNPAPEQEMVYEPCYFANPVQKTHDGKVTEVKNPGDHLVSYWIPGGGFVTPMLAIVNQFGQQSLDVYEQEWDSLAVPSEKINFTGPYPFTP